MYPQVEKRSTYTNNFRELQGLVLSILKIIGDRHGLSLAHLECEGAGAGRAELLDHARRLDFATRTGVSGEDSYSTDEPLKAETFTIRESTRGGQDVRVALVEVVEAKAQKRALIKMLSRCMKKKYEPEHSPVCTWSRWRCRR